MPSRVLPRSPDQVANLDFARVNITLAKHELYAAVACASLAREHDSALLGTRVWSTRVLEDDAIASRDARVGRELNLDNHVRAALPPLLLSLLLSGRSFLTRPSPILPSATPTSSTAPAAPAGPAGPAAPASSASAAIETTGAVGGRMVHARYPS
eukprot:scaffold134_cov244-Pinguiococcus_pyrenoidosus.AAC.2